MIIIYLKKLINLFGVTLTQMQPNQFKIKTTTAYIIKTRKRIIRRSDLNMNGVKHPNK